MHYPSVVRWVLCLRTVVLLSVECRESTWRLPSRNFFYGALRNIVRGGSKGIHESNNSSIESELQSVLLHSSLLEPRNNRQNEPGIYVTKRDGSRELLNLTKLELRLAKIAGVDHHPLDLSSLRDSIVRGLYNGVSSDDLDVLAAETAAALGTQHPAYAKLAARIVLTRNRKQTPATFSEAVATLAQMMPPR
jgi:ATP cone domain